MQVCKNCGAQVIGTYCNRCGQKIALERISFHYIWHGLVHFFTHAEHGFFYTTRELIVAPGRAVKNFLDGKRKVHQTPVSYFLIWNAIYILLLYMIGKVYGENRVVNFAEYFGPEEKTKFAISHLNIVLIFLLPFQAFYLWLVILFRRYNYFEAFVAMLYAIGTLLLWQCVFVLMAIPVSLLTGKSVHIQWSDIFKALYIGWFMTDFVKQLPVKFKAVRVMTVLLLVFLTFTTWRIFVFPFVADLFF
ncbi:MAG TPA: DUF3667 domain-containing protein [Chitinophagaceae bacterium]|nr:DUF3667 domain-containing protein [Chitinophagaceae bacterium]